LYSNDNLKASVVRGGPTTEPTFKKKELKLILIDHPNIVSTQVGMQMQVVKMVEKDSPDFRKWTSCRPPSLS